MGTRLKAPFPWFGGKSRAAHLVWERFGDVQNYVEPFAGSLAVLLGRPTAPRIETVNDLDCYLANFWRALRADPDGVARHADWPVNEADLHARHRWLHAQKKFRERVGNEPEFYDVKIAGWWVWGLSCWIGDNWCRTTEQNSLPHLTCAGNGVHAKAFHGDSTGLDLSAGGGHRTQNSAPCVRGNRNPANTRSHMSATAAKVYIARNSERERQIPSQLPSIAHNNPERKSERLRGFL